MIDDRSNDRLPRSHVISFDSARPVRTVFGLAAIALGMLFLLGNFGVIDPRWAEKLWPLVFVLIGLLRLLHTRRAGAGRFFVGAVFIAIGTAMTLDRLGLVRFNWDTWWPVVVILIGISMMFRRDFHHRRACSGRGSIHDSTYAQNGAEEVSGDADGRLDASAILGTYRRAVSSRNFSGGEITAMLGGCEIDLRGASMAGEAVLDTFALWGGIELMVPTDWTVIVDGNCILGGFDARTVTPPEQSKRLIIRGTAIMGGVNVRN